MAITYLLDFMDHTHADDCPECALVEGFPKPCKFCPEGMVHAAHAVGANGLVNMECDTCNFHRVAVPWANGKEATAGPS